MEELFTSILKISLVLLIVIYLYYFYKPSKERKFINSKINSKTSQTEDIRIYTRTTEKSFKEFDYCKFYFIDNEIFLKFRKSWPTNFYSIPLVVKKTETNKYSIFNLYTITFVELNETKLKIRFESKSFLKTEFFLNLENISNKDFLLLKENLC